MTTYITATPNPTDATVRLRIEAREDGYEDALNVDTYELDAAGITAELENWTLPEGVTASTGPDGRYLAFDVDTHGARTIARTVSGLNVGQTYRMLAGATFTSTTGGTHATMATLKFGVDGEPLKPFYENFAGQASVGGYADGDPLRTVFVFEWEATSTEHELAFEVTTTEQAAQLVVFALVAQTTPTTRAVFETYGQEIDDDLWTLYGAVPDDVGRGPAVEESGPPGARAIGFELENVGTGDVPTVEETFGQQVTITGLVPGLTYTARVVVSANRTPYDVAPPWVRIVVDGVEDGSSEPSWAGWQRVRFVATASSHVLRAQLVNAMTLRPGDVLGLFVHYARVDLVDEVADARRVIGLTRSDRNGARDVREVAGVRMEDGTYLVTDHEAALDGLVTYTVATQRIDVPDPAPTTEVATTSTRLAVPGNRFTQVTTPRISGAPPMVMTYEAAQQSSGTVHDVIDRADPLVTRGVLRLRRGRLTAWWPTYEVALEFSHVFDAGVEVLWRQDTHAGLDMYLLAENVRTRPYDERTKTRRWAVEVDYVEVAFPTAPIAGDAAWNFRAGAQRNATFWDDLREFPTFADRLNGPAQGA